MLTVSAAQTLILQHLRPLPSAWLPLGPGVLGAVLAEDVVSDLDMPPYDKALMDGFAVRSSDLPEGIATLDDHRKRLPLAKRQRSPCSQGRRAGS